MHLFWVTVPCVFRKRALQALGLGLFCKEPYAFRKRALYICRPQYLGASWIGIVQHIAKHCNTLQNTTHCNTLQHTAPHCTTEFEFFVWIQKSFIVWTHNTRSMRVFFEKKKTQPHIWIQAPYIWILKFIAVCCREDALCLPEIFKFCAANLNFGAMYLIFAVFCSVLQRRSTLRGGGLGSRPKKLYGERLGDGVEYHLMSPTPRC